MPTVALSWLVVTVLCELIPTVLYASLASIAVGGVVALGFFGFSPLVLLDNGPKIRLVQNQYAVVIFYPGIYLQQ